jgi:hypothetical protein
MNIEAIPGALFLAQSEASSLENPKEENSEAKKWPLGFSIFDCGIFDWPPERQLLPKDF